MDGINPAALLAIWAVCGLIGAAIGSSKGKAGSGFALGFVLGPLGAILALFLSASPDQQAKVQGRVSCYFCAEMIMPNAKVCPHCGREAGGLPAPADGSAAAWLTDPSGRHPDRWWDGQRWTQWVRDKPGGTRSEDPPVPAT